jgi:hypothetical protein
LTDTPLAGNLLSSEEKRQASAGRHPHDGLQTRAIAGSHR